MAADDEAAPQSRAPAKPHGDKLTVSQETSKDTPESRPGTGDSPKRQGDPAAGTIKGK
jgi:hypothetical protein